MFEEYVMISMGGAQGEKGKNNRLDHKNIYKRVRIELHRQYTNLLLDFYLKENRKTLEDFKKMRDIIDRLQDHPVGKFENVLKKVKYKTMQTSSWAIVTVEVRDPGKVCDFKHRITRRSGELFILKKLEQRRDRARKISNLNI